MSVPASKSSPIFKSSPVTTTATTNITLIAPLAPRMLKNRLIDLSFVETAKMKWSQLDVATLETYMKWSAQSTQQRKKIIQRPRLPRYIFMQSRSAEVKAQEDAMSTPRARSNSNASSFSSIGSYESIDDIKKEEFDAAKIEAGDIEAEEILGLLDENHGPLVSGFGGPLKLPTGWKKEVKVREQGATAGQRDTYFIDPNGK